MKTCLNCAKTEREVPLLQLRYQEREVSICPQCLPLLIHKPEKLAEKLPGMQPGQPAGHDH